GRRIEKLQHDAQTSIDSLARISALIEEVRPMFVTIAAAVEEQAATAGELSRNATTTSEFVGQVATSGEEIRIGTEKSAREIREVDEASKLTARRTQTLRTRFSIFLRQTEIGDRRKHERLPCSLAVTVETGGETLSSNTIDLGSGGVLIALPGGR